MKSKEALREENRIRKRRERARRRAGIPVEDSRHSAARGVMRPVRNVETGREYDSIAAAARDAMMPQSTVKYMLDNGTSRHGLSFEYAEVPDGR